MAPQESIWKKLHIDSLLTGVGCVFAGCAAACMHGNLEVFPATLCVLFVLFAQLSANIYNRYYDEANKMGALVDNLIAYKSSKNPEMMKELAIAMLMLAVMTGLALATMGGWWVFPIGIFIIAAGWFCCAGSMPLMRTPFSPICAFIMFGPVCVITTSLIQSQHEASESLSWFDISPAIFMSVAMGFMASNCTLVFNYSQYYSHRRNSRESMATILGRRGTRILFLANSLLSAAIVVWMCFYFNLPYNGLGIIPAAICLAVDIYMWRKMITMPRYRLEELTRVAVFNVLLMGFLSLVIYAFTGTPDDSFKTYF